MKQEGCFAGLPRCVVFITTLGCTARCRDCCFSASPGKANQRLRLQEMLEILDAVVETVPSVENVVFIGNLQELLRLWREFNSDPLALWLRWRGPFSMMEELTPQAAAEKREHVHPCLACRAALGPQEKRESNSTTRTRKSCRVSHGRNCFDENSA